MSVIYCSDVRRIASNVLPILGLYQIWDGTTAISSGALRGCGRQFIGAVIMFFGYYVLALPIGIPLALLTPMKVLGMWLGLILGTLLEAVVFMTLVLCTNWTREAELVSSQKCFR